jgi:hypothetical protein
MPEPTAGFLEGLQRELAPLQAAITELDGLWGKGIGHGEVDRRVLDELRKRKEGLKVQLRGLERLAAGEVPE